MMLLSMKNKILLKFYVNITVQKLIIKEILLYTMNSFISMSAVTGRAAFWAHQPISITTSPAPPPTNLINSGKVIPIFTPQVQGISVL